MTAEIMCPGDPKEPEKGGVLDVMLKLSELGLYYGMIGELETNPDLEEFERRSKLPEEDIQIDDIKKKASEILDEVLTPFTPRIEEKGLTFEQAKESIIDGYLRVKYPRIRGEMH